jgi:hypothetical protein
VQIPVSTMFGPLTFDDLVEHWEGNPELALSVSTKLLSKV